MIEEAIFFIYIAGIFGIGLFSYMQTSSLDDYFVAGRDQKWWNLTGTLMATTISGSTFVGLVAVLRLEGGGLFAIPFGVLIGVSILYLIVGPKLRDTEALTASDYMGARFSGENFQTFTSLVAVAYLLLYLVSVSIAGGLALEIIFGLDYWVGAILAVAATTIYTLIGGQKAVFHTDSIQVVIFMLVSIASVFFFIQAAGGLEALTESVSQNQNSLYLNWTGGGTISWISAVGSFLVWSLGYIGSPAYLTRFLAVDNKNEIIKGGMGYLVVYFLFWFVIFTLFTLPLIQLLPETSAEELWLQGLVNFTSPLVAGVGISAVFASAMSTGDTMLVTASTTIGEDIYRSRFRPEASDDEVMRVTRLTVVVCGALITILTVIRPALIIQIAEIGLTFCVGTFAIPMLFDLYNSEMNVYGAWASGLNSVVLGSILWAVYLQGSLPFGLHPIIPVATVSCLLMVVGSYAFSNRSKDATTIDRTP